MKKLFCLTLSLLVGLQLFASEPLWQGKGRIVLSSDGNEHDDDDWAATPMALAILAARGLQDKVALYTYSDHVWGSNKCFPNRFGHSAYEHMKLSAEGSKKWFKYKKTEFICAVDNPEKAYDAMAREINKSSEKNPLIIIGAGPMHVIGEGMNRSDKSKHQFVTLISHSVWNNVHADKPNARQDEVMHTGWTWNEMKEEFPTAKYVMIANQNGAKTHPGLFNAKEHYDWIKTADKVFDRKVWDFLYSRVEACKKKEGTFFDVSDAGMALFLLTGEDKTNPKMLEDFFLK